MNKNRKSPYFENVNSVIEKLTAELGLEKGLKISSAAKFWPNIVGPRFEKTSKIYSIQESRGFDTVLVAVNSSAVAQELTFYKKDILVKLRKLGENFGFNIKEINFSTKYWKEEEKQKIKEDKQFSEEELDQIKIPENVIYSIKTSLEEKSLLAEEQKERVFNTIIKDLKIRLWMKNNNYPICRECGIPMSCTNSEQKLCPSCRYK